MEISRPLQYRNAVCCARLRSLSLSSLSLACCVGGPQQERLRLPSRRTEPRSAAPTGRANRPGPRCPGSARARWPRPRAAAWPPRGWPAWPPPSAGSNAPLPRPCRARGLASPRPGWMPGSTGRALDRRRPPVGTAQQQGQRRRSGAIIFIVIVTDRHRRDAAAEAQMSID